LLHFIKSKISASSPQKVADKVEPCQPSYFYYRIDLGKYNEAIY